MLQPAHFRSFGGKFLRQRGFVAQIVRSLGMRVSAAGLAFVLVPVCIQILGVEGFGEYAVAISWMHILGVVAKLGFDTASLRYIPQYRSQEQSGLLKGFVRSSRLLAIGGSIVMGLLMVVGTWLCRNRFSEEFLWCLLYASCLLPVMSCIQMLEASLLACKRIVSGQMGGILLPVLLMMLLWATPSATGIELTSSIVVLLNLASAITTMTIMIFLSRGVVARGERSATPEVRLPEWISVSSPLLFVQLLFLLQNQSGTILCDWLISKEAAGLYAALTRVASVLLLGLQAIGMIAAPTVSSLYHSGRAAELQRYLRRCALASFGFAAAFAVLMLAGGRSLLMLIDSDLVDGYVPMVVMLGGLAIAAAAGPINQLMTMTGGQWDCIKVYGVLTGICLVLGYFMIPAYGVLGAAITAAVGRISTAAILVLFARLRHGLWCTIGRLPARQQPAEVPPQVAA